MTMIDSRDSKALEIASGGAQWLKCRARDGSKRYGVPSQRHPGVYHLADQLTCSCYDAHDHTCKHTRAVRLYVRALHQGVSVDQLAALPATVTIDGLAEMAQERGAVLDMVRHEDGEITWERHAGCSGNIVHLPRRTAGDYDRIFGKEA